MTTPQARQTLRRIAVLALLLSCPDATYAQPLQALLAAQEPPPTQTPPAVSQAPDPHDSMEPESTRLQLRGFADVQFRASNERGTPSTFSIGQLDLFITSHIAGDLSVISEVVFEADDENRYTLDVERLLPQFSPSDYFNVGVGRYHTAIGFYNNAYHNQPSDSLRPPGAMAHAACRGRQRRRRVGGIAERVTGRTGIFTHAPRHVHAGHGTA
jgi:hypothetical protein